MILILSHYYKTNSYQKIFNIDFSQIVIQNMKMRNTKRDYMIWETMDIKGSNLMFMQINKA